MTTWSVAAFRDSLMEVGADYHFITKLLRMVRGVDAIWVIVNRLTKSAHFLAISESSSIER